MISTARQHAPATQRTLIPRTTPERQQASLGTNSLEQDTRLAQKLLGKWDYDIENGEGGEKPHPEKTVLYLAYGSNMDTETFTGKRGIRPVSLVNVYVPELRLTFDLAALPYLEPCYATVRYRHVPDGREHHDPGDGDGDEKQPLVHEDEHNEDRKRWNKPLVGVVYELTARDYAWMISTESGGRGYRSGTVTCYPFPESYDPADEVPDRPTTQPFQAQSLLSWSLTTTLILRPAALWIYRRPLWRTPGSVRTHPMVSPQSGTTNCSTLVPSRVTSPSHTAIIYSRSTSTKSPHPANASAK